MEARSRSANHEVRQHSGNTRRPAPSLRVCPIPSASDQAFSVIAEATEDAMRTEQDSLFSAHAQVQMQARDYIGF